METLFTTARRKVFWLMLFGYFTAQGLLFFTHKYLDELAHGGRGNFRAHLIEEMAAAYAAALLFPLVLKFARRYRPDRRNWPRRLPLHLLALTAFSIAHTTLNGLLRFLFFPMAGLGSYNFGVLSLRYGTEFANVALFYCLFVTIIYLFDHYRRALDRDLRTTQLEARLAEAQLEALRLQLQPHFLFNDLNTISSVIYEDVQLADRMIAQLSDLLRLTLRNPPSQEVTLKEELDLLDRYLEIMRSRFEERLIVNLFVEPGTQEALVPQLILQPLVENSIKHAADPSSGAVTIDLCAKRENGSLLLEISDQGPGMDSNQHPILPEGVGLSNTAERLSHLYGEAQSLTFANVDRGGLIVRVQFPFHTSQGTG